MHNNMLPAWPLRVFCLLALAQLLLLLQSLLGSLTSQTRPEQRRKHCPWSLCPSDVRLG